MKILFTNHGLSSRSGTELYILEICRELSLRGHQVAVFSTVLGEVAKSITALGIPVVSEPRSCPFEPEVIHGQHHLETMAALCAWPRTPALYFVHGYLPWEERPPRHPRIVRYLSSCHAYDAWVKSECGVSEEQLVVINNHIDLPAFPSTRQQGLLLRSALLYHNAIEPDSTVFKTIKDSCDEMGWTLEVAGRAFSKLIEKPGEVLPGYDVVFATGRSAIEAIACGCAVVLVNQDMIGTWVSPEIFQKTVDRNFCILPTSNPSSQMDLVNVLRSIRPEDIHDMTTRVRSEFSLDSAVDRLEACYRTIIQQPVSVPLEEEQKAIENYLIWLTKNTDTVRAIQAEVLDRAKVETSKLRQKNKNIQEHLRAVKERLNILEERMTSIRKTLEHGNWLRRRLWRKLRRMWERPSRPDGTNQDK